MTARLPTIVSYAPISEAEIPAARAPWTLEADRAALLVHDMQAYFLGAYPPGAEPMASAIVAIEKLAAAARARGVPVFYTAQNGDQRRQERGLQADLWGPGMKAIPGHEAIPAPLTPLAEDMVLTKHRYSAFQRSDLEARMRERGRDQLIVCGVYAHIGCTLTVAEAFQRDIQPFLAADALGDFSREQHLMALSYVASCCGVPLSTRAILERLA